MRILHSTDFNYCKSLDIFCKNAIGLKKSFQHPVVLDKETVDLLQQGIAYIFGRDHAMRPIFVLNLRKFKQLVLKEKIATSVLRNFIRRFVSYMDEKLFVPGSVETFVLLVDCDNICYSNSSKVHIFLLPVTF